MKFIIFDIDGTLTQTKKVDDKCFMKAFEQTFGIDIWNEKWEKLKHVTDWGITEEIIHREWNRFPRQAEYNLMVSNFVSNLNSEYLEDPLQFKEVSGASNFFSELREKKNIELGIATGAWEKSANLKLDIVGIDIEGICFSNSNLFKSREAITEDVIDQLKSKYQKTPERIIYFGDGEWDFKTCINLGIDFIGIDVEKNGKLNNLGAKTVFNDYTNKDKMLQALDITE